jgi:flavodoxin
MRCLLVYYSLTGEAERAVQEAAAACRADGHEAVLCRVDFADVAERLVRPLSIATSKKWVQAANNGIVMPMVYAPADALAQAYDFVMIVSSTWSDHPSVPIRSFLEGPEGRGVMAGKPFGVFVVCRRLWIKNLAITRQLGEAAGGRFVDGQPLMHPGSQIGSLIQTVTYLRRVDGGRKRFLGIRLPEYGLTTATLETVPAFMRSLLARAAV